MFGVGLRLSAAVRRCGLAGGVLQRRAALSCAAAGGDGHGPALTPTVPATPPPPPTQPLASGSGAGAAAAAAAPPGGGRGAAAMNEKPQVVETGAFRSVNDEVNVVAMKPREVRACVHLAWLRHQRPRRFRRPPCACSLLIALAVRATRLSRRVVARVCVPSCVRRPGR